MAAAVLTGISSQLCCQCFILLSNSYSEQKAITTNSLWIFSWQKTESKDPQGAQIVTVQYTDTAEEKWVKQSALSVPLSFHVKAA